MNLTITEACFSLPLENLMQIVSDFSTDGLERKGYMPVPIPEKTQQR